MKRKRHLGIASPAVLHTFQTGTRLRYQRPVSMPSIQSNVALIPVRSERQAMDWSLVLVSQGIESVIQQTETGWALAVDPNEYQRALRTLRHFIVENRGWAAWRQTLPWPEVTFHWGATIWCAVFIVSYWLSGQAFPGL